jgi:hypothetical protein
MRIACVMPSPPGHLAVDVPMGDTVKTVRVTDRFGNARTASF